MPEINQWPKPKGAIITAGSDTFKLTIPASHEAFQQLSCLVGIPLLLGLIVATADLMCGKPGQSASPLAGRVVAALVLWLSLGSIIWFCGATFLQAWRRHLLVTVSGDVFRIGYMGCWLDRQLSIARNNVSDVFVDVYYSSGGEGSEPVFGGILVINYYDEGGNASKVRFKSPGLCPSRWKWVRDELRTALALPPK